MELETREYTAQTGRIIKAAQSGRLPLDWDSTSRLNGMSREELRVILGMAVAMTKHSMTGGQETLSHPLNPS